MVPATTNVDGIRRNLGRYVRLSDEDAERLARALRHRHIPRRATLLTAGDVCTFEAYVVRGCLRVFHADANGADHVLYFAPEDWWVTDVGSLTSRSPAILGIDALEPTDVLVLEASEKERLYAEVPQLERAFRIMAETSLGALQRRVIATMRQTADVRYLEFKEQYPDLEARVAQHQIAAYLGISPEFLSRIRSRQSRKSA